MVLPCPLHCCAPPSLSLPSSGRQGPARCRGPRGWTPASACGAPWCAAPTPTCCHPLCGSSAAPYCKRAGWREREKERKKAERGEKGRQVRLKSTPAVYAAVANVHTQEAMKMMQKTPKIEVCKVAGM